MSQPPLLLLQRLVPAEAGVEDKVGEGVVEVGPEADDAVVLVGVAQLLEEHVRLLQGAGQHHRLLVVH